MSPPPPRLIQNDLLLQFNCSSTHVCIIVQVVIIILCRQSPRDQIRRGQLNTGWLAMFPKMFLTIQVFMLYVDPEILL